MYPQVFTNQSIIFCDWWMDYTSIKYKFIFFAIFSLLVSLIWEWFDFRNVAFTGSFWVDDSYAGFSSLLKMSLILKMIHNHIRSPYSVQRKSIPPKFLLEIRVILKLNPIHSTKEFVRHSKRNERKIFNFSEFWIFDFGCLQKSQFFKSPNSWHFFTKISGNGL